MVKILVAIALAGVPIDSLYYRVRSGQQHPDKQLVATISAADLRGGIVSEITWDGGMLLLQGVFAQAGGELKAQYSSCRPIAHPAQADERRLNRSSTGR